MRGSCLCGAIAYQADAPGLAIGHCSCRTCRKAHGAPMCGSQLIAERPAEPHVVLRVATLDEDPGSKPLIHIWRSHEVPWCAYEGDVKAFAEWPPGRA